MQLTADLIEAFAGTFLSPRYDDPRPTPPFHRVAWALYASDEPQVLCVAPRDHAKSTALTFDFVLCAAMFRAFDYIIIIGSTEENATEQLGNISSELHENEDLQRQFGPFEFVKDQKTDIVVEFPDGEKFRILVRGAEQRIRGRLWNGKRPNLMVCDDMEDDEQVENKDRRKKFRNWFFRAAKQALSRTGKIRVHGTILHEESLLSRLLKNREWKHLFFKAHNSFDDFSGLLWPQRWSERDLRGRQREFIEDRDAAGYAQEFLNTPLDSSDAYLRREDFLAMKEDDGDYARPKIVCAAADFAVSKADLANRTSFTVGGKCERNLVHFLDQRVGRWDPLEWIEELFSIQGRWHPDVFWVEDGVIWKSVSPMIYREMLIRDIFINFVPVMSIKDKATRGRSLQKRMRAGGCRFDKETSWYADMEYELLRFTGNMQASLDDQFDSAALLSLGFDNLSQVEAEDFETPLEGDDEDYQGRYKRQMQGIMQPGAGGY